MSLERAFNHAYIGEVTLGRDSITFMSYGNQPHDLVTNPWQFCFEKNRYEEIKSHIGQNIVLEFKTPKNNNLLSCSAINELVAVYPVDEYQAQALEQTHLIGDVLTNNPEIAKGIEFGRIVNVIKNEGSHRNYFMTIQIGGGGSKFHHFVMDDPDLFAFSIISLKTAAMVKIHYSERLSNSFGLNSMSFVSEIEIID